MDVRSYITQLLAKDQYSFGLDEVKQATQKTSIQIKSELARLVAGKQLVSLRTGYYLIIPPRYARSQKLPINHYCDRLFDYLGTSYYLGAYTAANSYGASHQAIQRDYVITHNLTLRAVSYTHLTLPTTSRV